MLGLQTELELVRSALDATQAILAKTDSSPDISSSLEGLQQTHARLQSEVEGLYMSLNVRESMPLIKGMTMDILRILILARDLKINIRKRAINMFFEWDRLDQATGGREAALGVFNTNVSKYYPLTGGYHHRYKTSSTDSCCYLKTQAGISGFNPKV